MPENRDNRPNVLLIVSDQHHAGVMGCAGDPVVRTPALDGLAARGVLFDHAYCAAPLCGPSRMALMTARHPYETRCWSNEGALSSEVPTFAHGFTAADYQTVLCGRMHFVGADQRHGFLSRLVGDVPESAYLEAGWRLGRVLGSLVDTPGYARAGLLKSGPGRTGYHAYDELVSTTAADWLRRRGEDPKSPAPFLLVVGLAAPHCPFVAPPEDFAYYADLITAEDLPVQDPHLPLPVAAMKRAAGLEDPVPVAAQWRARVAYYGLCSFLDRQVGRVLQVLAETGLSEDTLVVYTSDHGEMLGEHGWWWKSTFHEAAVRVPLLWSWPGRAPAGRRVEANVSLLDLGPTLLESAGLPALPGVSGSSFTGRLAGSGDGEDTVWAEHAQPAGPSGKVSVGRMVKSGPWKYVYWHEASEELFHLDEDPGERRNRAGDPACAEVCARLRRLARQGWDPEQIAQRVRHEPQERALLKAWIDRTQPPEPDPLWFDEPPENWVDTSPEPPGPGRHLG